MEARSPSPCFMLQDPKGHDLKIRSGGSGGSKGEGWACDMCRDFYAPVCTAFNCPTCEYDLCFECAMKLTGRERAVLEALSEGVDSALYEGQEAFDLDVSAFCAAADAAASKDKGDKEDKDGDEDKLNSSKLVLAMESTFPDIVVVFKDTTFHVDVREVMGAVFWDVGYGEDEEDEGDEGESRDEPEKGGAEESTKRNAEDSADLSSKRHKA